MDKEPKEPIKKVDKLEKLGYSKESLFGLVLMILIMVGMFVYNNKIFLKTAHDDCVKTTTTKVDNGVLNTVAKEKCN